MNKEIRDVLREFVTWTKLKAKLHLSNTDELYFKNREVWWASVGLNVGFEVKGKGDNFARPVVILKALSPHTCLIIPLTKSVKRKNLFPMGKITEDQDYESFALLEQVRLIDKKRLEEKIGTVGEEVFTNLRKSFSGFINS
ncbi:MAG: type II toxin-antitoxin system PemK/MazF family toxin, partial [Candidatus Taylorbacteria bacterium]|nr:type II toxin-antitoxin system PemK/MazF family toxin [Candidatus Taylorbacteria bacterium]